MRVGLSTAAFYGRLETEDAAGRVAALGLPCCEVFLETYSEYRRGFGALVRGRLGDTACVSIHCKTQHFEGDIFGLSARQREDGYALMARFLDAGNALGARHYVYHGPAGGGSDADFAAWQPAVQRAIDLAAGYGIALCWEVVAWCRLNSVDRVALMRALWPQLGFVLDIKQVHKLGQDSLDYVRVMGPALRHVHVLDWDTNGQLVLPGQGVFDFEALADALKAIGYGGDIILEPYAEVVPNEGALVASIEYLKGVFE